MDPNAGGANAREFFNVLVILVLVISVLIIAVLVIITIVSLVGAGILRAVVKWVENLELPLGDAYTTILFTYLDHPYNLPTDPVRRRHQWYGCGRGMGDEMDNNRNDNAPRRVPHSGGHHQQPP